MFRPRHTPSTRNNHWLVKGPKGQIAEYDDFLELLDSWGYLYWKQGNKVFVLLPDTSTVELTVLGGC